VRDKAPLQRAGPRGGCRRSHELPSTLPTGPLNAGWVEESNPGPSHSTGLGKRPRQRHNPCGQQPALGPKARPQPSSPPEPHSASKSRAPFPEPAGFRTPPPAHSSCFWVTYLGMREAGAPLATSGSNADCPLPLLSWRLRERGQKPGVGGTQRRQALPSPPRERTLSRRAQL